MPKIPLHLRTLLVAVAAFALCCDFATQWRQARQIEMQMARITRCCFGTLKDSDNPIRLIPRRKNELARLEVLRPVDRIDLSELRSSTVEEK